MTLDRVPGKTSEGVRLRHGGEEGLVVQKAGEGTVGSRTGKNKGSKVRKVRVRKGERGQHGWRLWSRAKEGAEVGKAIREWPQWGTRDESVSGEHQGCRPWRHLKLASSQGLLALGGLHLPGRKDAGFWQMPGAFSNFWAGPHQDALGIGCPQRNGQGRRAESVHSQTAWSYRPGVSLPVGSPTLLRSAGWLMRKVKKLRLDHENTEGWRR